MQKPCGDKVLSYECLASKCLSSPEEYRGHLTALSIASHFDSDFEPAPVTLFGLG